MMTNRITIIIVPITSIRNRHPMHYCFIAASIAASLLLGTSFAQAQSLTGQPDLVVEQLKGIGASSVNFTSSRTDGDTLVLEKVLGTMKTGAVFSADEIALKNPRMEGGSFRADAALGGNVVYRDRGTTFTSRQMALGEINGSPGFAIYRYLQVRRLYVEADDKPSFAAAGADIEVTNWHGNLPSAWNLRVLGIDADAPAKGNVPPGIRNALANGDLGMDIASTWDPKTGGTASNMSLSLGTLGRISVSSRLFGITESDMKLFGPTEMARSPKEVQALIEKMQLIDASVELTNTGLIEEIMAAQPRPMPLQAFKPMIPMMTMKITNPGLKQQIEMAANAFLDNPWRLRISVRPQRPMSFMSIADIGKRDPSRLITETGLSIEANP